MKGRKEVNRRHFLKGTTAAGAAAAFSAAPALAKGRAGANDRIRVAVVGLGGRMRAHISSLAEMADESIEIAALCDCDQSKLNSAAARYPEIAEKKLTLYSDQRKLFDDKSIDAVSFATPDHWHALQTIWACQAGKDVYVEKPGTHNLFEGRQMVAAARRYERIVQHGTQMRSSPNIIEGIRKLHEGLIGDIYMARGVSFKLRGNLGKNKPVPVPPGLNWDAWVGPAPKQPYSWFKHRRWYWTWDFSSGDMANQAIHQLDIIRWGMGLDTHPTKIQSMGGHFVHDDDQETPNSQTFTCQYGEDGPLVQFESRNWHSPNEAGFRDQYPFVDHHNACGATFFGTKGYMIFPDYSSYRSFLGPKREPGPSAYQPGEPMMDKEHFQNWIAAVRSRNHNDLTADIEEGRMSMALSLLGNVAYRTGRTLQFDPQTERCVGDDEANELIKFDYRRPYVVPEEV